MTYEDELMDGFFEGMSDDEIVAFQNELHKECIRHPEFAKLNKLMNGSANK